MYKLIKTNSVKRLADGACIPFADGNIDYEEYKLWLSEGNIPEPEFTDEELVAIEITNKKQEALSYLGSTDWYVTRKLETGVEIPIEIFIKRAEARLIL